MERRDLLRFASAAATGALGARHAWAGRGALADPFALGVASGASHETGLVLWTRIAPAALPSPLAPVELRWEIAHDEGFRRIAASGRSIASPTLGHAVHVEVDGLAPGRWYHYRFLLGDAASDTGRTRTAPAADTLPDRLRFVFASCQRWEHGFYAAWRDAARQSPDLIVFLGDYIYEYASPHTPPADMPRSHMLRHATTLADYRDRYALHKSDPDLRAAHRACPWLVTWDDHEVENDYAGMLGQAAPDRFLARRAAAYQAFYENMPLPASALARGLAGLGTPDAVRVTQRHAFGRLARFHLLDTRQFRDPQACRADAGEKSPGAVRPSACPAIDAPGRSLLGAAQEAWLAEGLADDARHGRTRWTIVAQQTLVAPRRYGGPDAPVATDTWDGYPAARRRLLDAVVGHAPRNTVFVGGDIHQNYVSHLHRESQGGGDPGAAPVATEFCGTSVSSRSGASAARRESLLRRNPHIVFADGEKRGYGLVDLGRDGWQTRLRTVDRPDDADSPVQTAAVFQVRDGRPRILVE
ncbi:alkaline phosphatase D family protein [Xylophilus sp. GOD-11R]|uniref:alkaline phosphatase D family protein n=1 Tax=Xylophilus sp. GOD-11R TaxID=3089814 RepID=UPI00298C49EF|nr:alkaline phosphatase D family protein [Xylophilus sp. GOD-11R]WPB58080.1 alkaline phosphatase D family protein [Xylophilus sp. GOD-11R]